MSDAHTETPEAPLAKVLNLILNFAVPGTLLIMLGFVGFKFIAAQHRHVRYPGNDSHYAES